MWTLWAKTIKKNTNSTQNKSQTHCAKQYEVTSFLSTDCELSTETCSKNVYSLGPVTAFCKLIVIWQFQKSSHGWVSCYHPVYHPYEVVWSISKNIAFVITLLTTWSSSILMTCPYHFSLLSVIFLDACTTFVVPRMCSFLILSFLVTPHIHLSILISFTSILDSCRLVVAQVSAPYSIAGLTTVL